MHCSSQWLIDNVSVLCEILRWIAVKQWSKHIAGCLVHIFTNGIQLLILAGWFNILDVDAMEAPLKCASNEFTVVIMYTMHRVSVTWQRALGTCVMCVTWDSVVNSNQLNQIQGSANTHEHIEFNLFVVGVHNLWANHLSNWLSLFPECYLHFPSRQQSIFFAGQFLSLTMITLELFKCVSKLGVLIALLKCFMQINFARMPHDLAEPCDCSLQHLLW